MDRIQFKLPGGAFRDIPLQGLYVKTGTRVDFQALPFPPDANFPQNEPVWGGTCGANGNGPTTSVLLNTPSSNMNDYQTITATCGNNVINTIVRYGPDEATIGFDWYDSVSYDVAFVVTYKLWAPDDDGDGKPDAPGGTASIRSFEFDNVLALIGLPTDPPLYDRASWAFANGEPSGSLKAFCHTPDALEEWGVEVTGEFWEEEMQKPDPNPPPGPGFQETRRLGEKVGPGRGDRYRSRAESARGKNRCTLARSKGWIRPKA